MKKKILLMVAIVAVLICVFAISANAAVTPNNDGEVYVTSDNKTLALYDAEGKALAWFKDSSVEFGYVAYRVEIDFTCTLTQGGKEIHTNSPTLHDTDNNPETVFPYSLADMVLLNGRDYASFTQISGAFNGYPLEAVYVNSKFRWINQTTFRESNIRVFDIPKTHTGDIHFGNMCFWKALNLQYIFIPNGATLSGDAQFQHTAIRSLEFGPECKITAIGRYAFYDCKNLTGNVVIPNTVASIGDYAFALPSNIENNTNSLSIVLPSALSTVGEKFFQNNNSLVSISFTGTRLTAINSPAFENCKRLTAIALPEGLTTLGNCAFKNCTSLTTATFPSTLSTLNDTNHFYNNTSLTTVIGFENTSLTATSPYMFNGCSSLTSISLPVCMEEIAGWTFTDCTDLTSVIIPENSSLEVIRNYAFEDAESLTSVRLPNSLRTLEMGAFNRTYALASVENLENTQLTVITTQAFHGAPLTKLTLPSGLTEIGKDAFKGNKIVQDVLVIPNGVTVIGGWAFAGVENVTRIGKIVLPASLQSFGDNYVFEKTSFSSMVIPAGLAQVKQGVFNKLSTKGVVFYFTGTEAQAKTLQTGAGSNNDAFTGATTADLTTYTNASDKTTKNYIVFGIDPCEAFYGGHAEVVLAAKDATCVDTGLTEGRHCSRCQKIFAVQSEIPALGHAVINHDAKQATCTENGWNAYETCSRCDYTTYEEITASGHAWTVTGSACENNCGLTRGAYIGNTNYATFAEAYAAANAGDTIVLVTDITSSEIITIDKSVTIDGNGFTLTSTAARAINIDTTGTVVISNLTVNAGERAFNIINQASTVTLNNVNATAKNNAVMLATSATGATLTVNGSTFVGLATVNVASANSVVEINNTTITNCDATKVENYGAISTYKTATNSTVTVNGGKITVGDDSVAVSLGIPSVTVTLNNVSGNNETQKIVAYIGDAGYTTLSEAISDADADDTITLVDNITSSEIITIDKSVTIDGNGYTLTSTAFRAINIDTTGTVVISNLTVKAGERAINIINKPSNVTLNNVTATAANNAVMLATSAQGANLTVNNCDFTGLATVNVASANSVVVINDTKITNVDASKTENYGAISIFKTAENSSVAVNGGEIIVGDDSLAVSIGIPSATATLNNVAGSNTTQNVVAYIGNAGFATIEEALKEAKAGNTITLVDDVVLTSLIKIEKAITLDLGTYTVSTSAKKAFELYADATIINGTIAGACRCIDTRKAVNLTLENVTLIADKYYSEYSNQQPLTIGGDENGTVVTMNNVTINAGTQGYDITSFVKTTFNATDCTFIGYIGLNVKNGSEESTFNFVNCDFTVDISKNDVAGNKTALIYVESSSVAINLDAESTVTLIGNHTYIAYVADIKTVVVTLPSAYASDVVKSEYTVIDNANGTITVACPHAEAVVVNYIYANGYEAKGICVSKCTACDVELTSEAPRLFKFLGYSVPVDGKGEIAIGFEINKEAIAAYESVTGYKLSYGIFAALESIGTKDIFDANSGAITAAVASTSSAFDFKITGIESAEYKALNMAMGAYVIAENGTEKTVSYMQGGKPEAEAKYIFVSYDLIASNS